MLHIFKFYTNIYNNSGQINIKNCFKRPYFYFNFVCYNSKIYIQSFVVVIVLKMIHQYIFLKERRCFLWYACLIYLKK